MECIQHESCFDVD
ncbi:putative hc protease EUO, partial [Chlamydia psittaci 84-8471/1]